MESARLSVEQVGDIDIPEGNDADAGAVSDEGCECIEMWLMAVRRDDDEFTDAVFLPGGEELVDGAVKCFLAQGSGTGVLSFGGYIDAIVHGGCAQHAELSGEIDSDASSDEHVAAERQVRAVLLEGADGYDQTRIAPEMRRGVYPAQLVEAQ
jgi:hypothetical protein